MGFGAPKVLAAFAVAVAALAAFVAAQARGAHPIVPFVMSLYLWQLRGCRRSERE